MKYIRTWQLPDYLIAKDKSIRNINGELIANGYDDIIRVNGVVYNVDMLYMHTWLGRSDTIPFRDDTYYPTHREYDNKSFILKLNDEEFKRIPKFTDYYINKYGLIYSSKRGIFVKRTINQRGYIVTTITDDTGYRRPMRVHRLVYMAWVGEIPEDYIVDHKNGNTCDPSLDNIRCTTQSINVKDGIAESNGLKKWKEKDVITLKTLVDKNTPRDIIYSIFEKDNYTKNDVESMINRRVTKLIREDFIPNKEAIHIVKKLSDEDVINIKRMFANNISSSEIQKKYNISATVVNRITRGLMYAGVKSEYDYIYNRPKMNSDKLGDDMVREIRKSYTTNKYNYPTLAKMYNTTEDKIRSIVKHEIYRHVL